MQLTYTYKDIEDNQDLAERVTSSVVSVDTTRAKMVLDAEVVDYIFTSDDNTIWVLDLDTEETIRLLEFNDVEIKTCDRFYC